MDSLAAFFFDTKGAKKKANKKETPRKISRSAERVEGILQEITTPNRTSGSTDANLPLSMGIPAVCPGFIGGAGLHTTEEYIVKDSLAPGLAAALKLVDSYL